VREPLGITLLAAWVQFVAVLLGWQHFLNNENFIR
jgi:hypothetical protein